MQKKNSNFVLKAWEVSPVGTIAAGVVLFFFAKWGIKKIVKAASIVPPKPEGIPDPKSIPSGWRPEPLANELHSALDGWPGSSQTKGEVYAKLTALTDGQFISVYNTFNKLYYKEGEGTMVDWIRDEDWQPSNTDVILSRFLYLGLK